MEKMKVSKPRTFFVFTYYICKQKSNQLKNIATFDILIYFYTLIQFFQCIKAYIL